MFERRNNFDLRRLLSGASRQRTKLPLDDSLTEGLGTEPLLHSLLGRLEWDIAMSTSSLHCLKMEPMLRKSIADVLVPTSKIKVCPSWLRFLNRCSLAISQDILYVILIAQGKVITLVRPKKHSIHPSGMRPDIDPSIRLHLQCFQICIFLSTPYTRHRSSILQQRHPGCLSVCQSSIRRRLSTPT